MDARISRSVAVATLVAMPLLAGCGAGDAPSGSTPASASSQAAAPSGNAAAAPTAVTTPSVDAAQTGQVQAATEKFVRTVLTIGYPDQTFEDYGERIEPLMTKGGFASFESPDSVKKGSSALKSLYAQRARSAPKLSDAPQVVSLEDARATARVDYENLAQQRSGSEWKTLKSLGTGSVTVTLVLDDGKWLVDKAS